MNNKTILFVDDEAYVLNALKRVAMDEGYTFLTAGSAQEGLEILAEQPIHLVISDQKMPGMTGIEFLKIVRQKYPDTVRIILSGYADLGTIFEAIDVAGIFRFLAKPWHDEELLLTIRQCLAHYDYLQHHQQLVLEYQRKMQKLEEMNRQLVGTLDQQTASLQRTQQLFQKVPIPLMGINCGGFIDLLSSPIHELPHLFDRLELGMSVHAAFPEPMAECIENHLKNPEDELSQKPLLWEDGQLQLRVISLKDQGAVTGCLIVLEEI